MDDSRYSYYVKNFSVVFRRALKRQLADAIERLSGAHELYELQSINPVLSEKPISEAILQIYQSVGTYNMKQTINAIRGSKKALTDVEKLYMARMQDYVEKNCGKKIKWITSTSEARFKEVVKREVTWGMEKGSSIDTIANEIRKSLIIEQSYRAVRIARTETIGAANAGSLTGAKDTGLNLEKGWLAARRENVRNSHKKMNGVFVDLNAMFQVPIFDGDTFTGNYESLSHPGDTNGSGGNIINCRCTLVYRRKQNSYQQGLNL